MSTGRKSDQCLAFKVGRAEAGGSDLNRLGADRGKGVRTNMLSPRVKGWSSAGDPIIPRNDLRSASVNESSAPKRHLHGYGYGFGNGP